MIMSSATQKSNSLWHLFEETHLRNIIIFDYIIHKITVVFFKSAFKMLKSCIFLQFIYLFIYFQTTTTSSNRMKPIYVFNYGRPNKMIEAILIFPNFANKIIMVTDLKTILLSHSSDEQLLEMSRVFHLLLKFKTTILQI